jgi:hypothetical protein
VQPGPCGERSARGPMPPCIEPRPGAATASSWRGSRIC